MVFKKKRPVTRPRQKLTPVQERRLLKIVSVLLFLALLWIFFAPGAGLFTYMKRKSELKKLHQQTTRIEQENIHLQQEIDRLNSDKEYLERVARKEYGLLKKNEQVFDFSKNKTD